jgi:transcriptional regulator with XRE-family HTH domain
MGLGQRLKQLRQQAGLTQKELEALSHVPQNTISRIELESVKAISSTTLMSLARALHVSTDALLGMDAESEEAATTPATPSARQPVKRSPRKPRRLEKE